MHTQEYGFLISVAVVLLAFATAAMSIPQTTRARRLALITLASLTFILTVVKAAQDAERERTAPFVLKDSDIKFELTAYRFGDIRGADDAMKYSPSALKDIAVLVEGGEGGWTCTVEPAPGVNFGGGHGPTTLNRYYYKNDCKRLPGTLAKYIWDLSGKTLRVSNQESKFSDLPTVWSFEAKLIVGPCTLEESRDKTGSDRSPGHYLEFPTQALAKENVLADSPVACSKASP